MIFIDDDTWPPSLHGTGTEDYFNHAWGMQRQAYPYHGAIVHEGDVPGYAVSYRFHGPDPVRFERRLKVTIEHGHANHLADDWASTAYWYQLHPLTEVTVADVRDRLPSRPAQEPPVEPHAADEGLASQVEAAREALAARSDAFFERLGARYADAIARAEDHELRNTRAAADVRNRFPSSRGGD
jgi:hypothetical protein